MPTESLFPNGEANKSNFTGSYLDVDSAPDTVAMSPTDDGTNSACTFSFPTPTGNLNTGAGLQTINIYLRKELTGGNDPSFDLYIREGGSATNLATLATAVSVTSDTSFVLYSYTWDASVLANIDGSGVEVHIDCARSGGSPGVRRNIAIDSLEWVADYAGGTTVTGSGTPAAQAATVSGSGERIVTGTGTPAAQAGTVAGSGERTVSGTGTPASQSATVAGTGERIVTGSGAPASQAATVAGTGTAGSVITGSGTPAAQSATVSGSGTVSTAGAETKVIFTNNDPVNTGTGDRERIPVTVQDARIKEIANTTNHDDFVGEIGRFSAGDTTFYLIQFVDIESHLPPDATIVSANLRLYMTTDAAGESIDVRTLLQSWVESEVTWDNRSTGNAWNTGGALGAGTDRTSATVSVTDPASTTVNTYAIDLPVTSAVQDWVDGVLTNHGFHLQVTGSETTNTNFFFFTVENSGSNKPELEVVYTTPEKTKLTEIPKEWHPDWATKRRKPTVPVEIDTDHPLSEGIEEVFLHGHDGVRLRRNRNPILHADWQGTRLASMRAGFVDIGGVGFWSQENTDASYSTDANYEMRINQDTTELNTYTLMGVFTTTGASNNAFYGFVGGFPDGTITTTNNAVSRTIQGLVVSTDAGAEYYTTNVSDLALNRLHVAGYDVLSDTLTDIWTNGELDDTYSGLYGTAPLRWANFGVNVGHSVGEGTRYMTVVWNRKLTRAEHKSFSDDPYQILKPVFPMTMALPVAAGGPTTVTGSGAPQAQAATVAGSGTISRSGSGTPAAQAATVAGTAERIVTGSGTPTAQSATVAGAGARVITGTGTPAAQAATVAGSGEREVTGTGSPAAQDGTVAGSGLRLITGSGAPQSQASTVAGSGTVSGATSGSGTPAAQSATVAGTGLRVITGSGSPQAQDGTVAGTGTVSGAVSGSGAPAAQDATVSGTGLRLVTGTGAPAAQEATVAGSGTVTGAVTGSGAPQAQDATVSGTGLRLVTGTGALAAQEATVAGSGDAVTTGSGAAVAQEATVAGTGLRVINGSGAPAAQEASVSGTAERTVSGSGAAVSQDGTVAGTGLRVITGTGAIQSEAANVLGATGQGPTDVDDLRVARADFLTVDSDTDRLAVQLADELIVRSA